MKTYQKILVKERFTLSDDVFVYEEKKLLVDRRTVWASCKVQPTFESRFWEVYVLVCRDGFLYVVIGKHRGQRVFYKKDTYFSRFGRFYCLIGRDLAFRSFVDSYWTILSAEKGKLLNITSKFLVSKNLRIEDVKYSSPVVSLVQVKQYEEKGGIDVYWKQTENGYVQVPEKKVDYLVLQARGLPEDPLYDEKKTFE